MTAPSRWKLREKLTSGQETREAILKLNDEIEMEGRWQTLHARDGVLAALSDASRVALRQWVESLKAGKTISVEEGSRTIQATTVKVEVVAPATPAHTSEQMVATTIWRSMLGPAASNKRGFH